MKTKIICILGTLALIFTVFGQGAFAYAQDELSRAASGVIYYDEEIDPAEEEMAEIEFELRDHDGRSIDEDVYFYIESSRDLGDVDFYYDSDGDHPVEYERNNIWRAETDHEESDFNGTYISIWAETNISGELNLYIGKEMDDDIVRRLFTGSEYGGEITLTVGEYDIELYEMWAPDSPAKAGRSYEIGATVWEYEDGRLGPEARDVEVTFFERKEGDTSWQELGTEKTDRRGEAVISVRNEEASGYEYTAEVGEVEKEYDETRMSVAASDPSDVEALEEEMSIGGGEEKVYFRMSDGYGNINKDVENGVANYEDYSWRNLDEFDYTERLEATVYDPGGESEEYYNDDIEYCPDNEAMFVEIDFDELGLWEVEAQITGTSITALTEVEVKEFGTVEDMELELDNKVMRNFTEAGDTYNFDYYQDDTANVYLIDEDGVRLEYDTGEEEVLFSSSNTGVASIGSREGDLRPSRTGESEIAAYHQDADLEASQMLYLSNEPVEIEVEADIEEGELEGEIIMTMLDEDGIRALPGEFETYTEDGTPYADEFTEEGDYDLVIPEGLEAEDIQDFQEGAASFSIKADDYDEYTVRVYTDFGLSKRFELEFSEEEVEITPDRKEMVLTIDESDYLIDGELHMFDDVEPFIRDDRTYLPIRAIMEAFDADVTFDAIDSTITVETDETTAVFTLDETSFTINGQEKEMDVVPYLDAEENRSYLPVRYFSEDALGADVQWDGEARTVTIRY